jgi:hypothetical protein
MGSVQAIVETSPVATPRLRPFYSISAYSAVARACSHPFLSLRHDIQDFGQVEIRYMVPAPASLSRRVATTKIKILRSLLNILRERHVASDTYVRIVHRI